AGQSTRPAQPGSAARRGQTPPARPSRTMATGAAHAASGAPSTHPRPRNRPRALNPRGRDGHVHFLKMRTGHFASLTIRSSTGPRENFRSPPSEDARIISNDASALSRNASDTHGVEQMTLVST